MLLRGMIRLFGYLMLALAALGAAVIVQHAATSGPAAGLPAGGLPPHFAYVGLAIGAWLLSVIAIGFIDVISHFPRRSRDPYEDHPKMSPSVQPRHIAYRELPSNRGGR